MINISKMKNLRNSNIEILRLISMIFIICTHYVEQTNTITNTSSVNNYIISFLSLGSGIANNIFIIVSCFFLVNAKFSVSRILKMHRQLLFYTVLLTLAGLLFWRDLISAKDIVRGFLPFFGRALWFYSAYITLLFFKPILDEILKSFDVKHLTYLVATICMFIIGISSIPDPQTGYILNTIWFLCVYIIIGYCVKADVFKKLTSCFIISIPIVLYVSLVSLIFVAKCNSDQALFKAIGTICMQYISGITTLPNFLSAFTVFAFVLNRKKWTNSFVNQSTSHLSSVYIIHQTPAFIPFLWYVIFGNCYLFDSARWYGVLLVSILTVIGCSLFDIIRVKVFENIILRTKCFERIINNNEKLLNKITMRIGDD